MKNAADFHSFTTNYNETNKDRHSKREAVAVSLWGHVGSLGLVVAGVQQDIPAQLPASRRHVPRPLRYVGFHDKDYSYSVSGSLLGFFWEPTISDGLHDTLSISHCNIVF